MNINVTTMTWQEPGHGKDTGCLQGGLAEWYNEKAVPQMYFWDGLQNWMACEVEKSSKAINHWNFISACKQGGLMIPVDIELDVDPVTDMEP